MTDLPEVSARADVVRILPLSVLVKAICRGTAEHHGAAPSRIVASPVQVHAWCGEVMEFAAERKLMWVPMHIMGIPVFPGVKDALPELQWVKTVEG